MSTHQLNLRATVFHSIINPLTKIWVKNLEANSSTNLTLNYQNTLDSLNYLSDNINNNNNNITLNNTVFSDDPTKSSSDSPNLQYCSFGDVGCSLLTIASTFHVIYIFYVLYKSLSLWRHQFKQNRQIFFAIDIEQNRMRNILAYGMKIFLQVLAGLEALIMSILVVAFHRNGGMVIFVICTLNYICCFCSAAFIYFDAITFKQTLRRTFIIILINCFQNGFIFAILLFCNAREHIDAYCFICACVYILTEISSAVYTIIRTYDFIEVNLENFDQVQNQNSASLLNASQEYANYTNSEQNMYQQQTTLDYGQYRSQNNSNLQNHQNPNQNYNNPHAAVAHKQSKLEEENTSRSNNKNNYKQMQQTGFSSRISTLSNAQNTQNNNNNNNNNNSSINIINTGSSNNLVKKSSMTPKTPGMITNTLEDSFSSINHCENLSEDDNSYENNPNYSNNNNNNNGKLKNQKKNDQKNRMQLTARSKSSIQCIGRKDFNSNDDSLDRIEEEDGKYEQKKQSQIQGLFIGDNWSGSVDFTDNNQQNSNNQNINKSNLISNLKQYQIQMNNNYHQSFQRQPTVLTDTLQSSVDLMSSNQFITPSFTNHPAQIESHTNSSCNRDSLYLSQQITTPSFSQNFHQYNSNTNNNNNHSSAKSSSNSSLKKADNSIFSQPQQQNDYHQQQNINISNLKRNSNLNCYENSNIQAASLNSASPSLAANSGETAAFQLNSAGDHSDISSKQDSSQTSDSYLMNGGQNNQNKMMKQKNYQQGKQQQNAQIEQQDKKTVTNQITKQKSLNMATSPQNSSLKSSPQSTDLITKSQDKQHVLNQMNDLLFCKKQTQSNIQSQQVSPQSNSQQQIKKVTKTGSSDDFKKMVNQTENTNKKAADHANYNYAYQLQPKKGNESSKSQDNLYKLDSQDESLGYYQERYSDLKVVSFEQSEKFDKRTVVFNISFFDSKGESMIIQRSYREFNDLYKYLSSKYRQYKFANFPKKQNKAQLSSQELVDRTNQFNIYLQSVVTLIKEEVNVINHFLSKETNCFSSQAVINQTNQHTNEKQSKSFAQSPTSTFTNTSKQQSNLSKINTLPCKPRSVPETIFEDANDCSNVLTDSNASKIDNQDEYNTKNYYNYSRNRTSDQQQLSQSKNNLNNSNKIEHQSSKNISSSSSTSGKQFGKQ
ncbi:PX domain protein (macronuclear) [Tetrahymena thermophila SB210]|uniref:PX domain protein n=1 Tax=Tetrahymena thermophila (strain SB210) TaxID=312017 RepID=Q23BR6_TETTS|nr:PX domain protein [Tetrahymena thermophila SB210]EAR94052.1 PX domain protein [Tetrahymena thermophila SB210]|eukprot:XP_001014297.1 PX domain protein [Tetrahymena thermophila SB210]